MDEITQESLLRVAIKHYDALVAYAYGILRDWGLAQDAVQEGLIVVSRKWQTFKPDASVYRWVQGIVRFKALDIIRSRKREVVCGDEDFFALVEKCLSARIDEDAVGRMNLLKSALQTCMGKLAEKARSILLGFYGESLSGEALARKFNMSHSAVRLSLSRIRKKLRECTDRQLRVEKV